MEIDIVNFLFIMFLCYTYSYIIKKLVDSFEDKKSFFNHFFAKNIFL